MRKITEKDVALATVLGRKKEEKKKHQKRKNKKERKTYIYVKRYKVHYWKPWFGKWSLRELITVEIEVGKHRKW
jgi:hypothetical protein